MDSTWEKVLKEHGVVHILINNAAIAMGKRVDEMKPQEVKLMMDNNFISYVHLTMLFLKQKELSSATKHRF